MRSQNSLIHTGHISANCRTSGGDRGGGWLRVHLNNSTEEEAAIFTEALEEVLGRLEKPRLCHFQIFALLGRDLAYETSS